MSVPPEPTEAIEPTSVEPGPGTNPSWNEVLSVLPEQFHGMVTPHFQKWDEAANARIESLNTQFEQYKPFVDHGIGRDQIETGLRLAQMIETNPQQVYDALAESLGITKEEIQQVVEENKPAEATVQLPPGYERLEQAVNVMAQQQLAQQQERMETAAAATLDQELTAVKEKYGEFDEKLFLPFLSTAVEQNKTTAQAAEEFFAIIGGGNQAQTQQPYAPRVMGANSGGGAGLPSNKIDVTKLDGKGTRGLVVEYLRQAAQQQ